MLDLQPVDDDTEITGAFARIEPSQIQLIDYQSHDPIRAPMAV